jgi:riboflavin synthase
MRRLWRRPSFLRITPGNRELTEQSSCSIVTARGWPGPTSAESHRDTAHSDSAESLENLQLMSQGELLEVKRGP